LGVLNVSKRFGTQVALNSVSLRFLPSQVVGLAGHNGSGKSTLIKAMAGYHSPEPGAEVVVDGIAFPWQHVPEAWAKRVRFLHQDLGLVPSMDAVENFALAGGYLRRGYGGIDWRMQRVRTAGALERLGAQIDLKKPVSQLSNTDRTMLCLARAFSDLPEDGLLVLDEPTASLTAQEAEPLFESIQQVVEHGAAVLLVTHHLDELLAHADSIAVLREGQLVRQSPAASLSRRELAAEVAGASSTTVSGVERRPRGRSGSASLIVSDLAGARLNSLSFEAYPGEIVGVAGLSGSGRDDVAALLAGGKSRLKGSVLVNGRPVPNGNPRKAVQLGIAYAPAERRSHALFPQHSAGENVTLPGLVEFVRRFRIRPSLERNAALNALDECELVPLAPNAPILQFSGGNQQKAVLARCLRGRPAVLLLDEPTQGVDVGGRSAIFSVIRDAADLGATVVLCSSDDEELAELCDRVIVLMHGNVGRHLAGNLLTASAVAHATLGENVLQGA